MDQQQIQSDIAMGDRDESSFTDDELLLAFKESLSVGLTREAQLDTIKTHILPRVYNSDGEIDFDGQNCDDCSGWDGMSRRCNCGNRRVSWGIDHGIPYASAD